MRSVFYIFIIAGCGPKTPPPTSSHEEAPSNEEISTPHQQESDPSATAAVTETEPSAMQGCDAANTVNLQGAEVSKHLLPFSENEVIFLHNIDKDRRGWKVSCQTIPGCTDMDSPEVISLNCVDLTSCCDRGYPVSLEEWRWLLGWGSTPF